ncbi:MAG TPA: hypothetical protein VEI04_08040 [Syntrophobacteria bacterium]|nr:hypothetical protein [Syntrophobacteria bacterium]
MNEITIDDAPLGVSISFLDLTRIHRVQAYLLRVTQERNGVRGVAVHQRRAGDHQRGAAVH